MTIKILLLIFILAFIPGIVLAQQQRGGTVTEDYFGEPVQYTNATNRTISVEVSTLNIDDDQVRELEILGVYDYTVKAVGNVYWYKQTYPIGSLVKDTNITIPLNDGRIDDYLVCAWLGKYDSKDECDGINTVRGMNHTELDLTDEFKYVYNDVKQEATEEADRQDE